MLLIHSTFPSEKEAKKAGRQVVSKKLAACASIFPCTSIYFWKGKLCEEKEWSLELKAKKENYKKIESLLLKIHPYERPAIYSIKTEKSEKKFELWVKKP